MRRAIASTVLTAAVLAAAPAAAHAAAPWSEPLTVPGSERVNPYSIGLSLGNADRGALSMTSGIPAPTGQCTQIGAVLGVGRGAPGTPRSLAPYDLAAPAAAYGNTRSIVLQRRTLNCDNGTARLAVSFASLPGGIGQRRILDSSVKLDDAAVAAVNPRGEAAIAWTEDRGYSGRRANPDRLYLSLRRPGAAFGRPSVIVGSGKMTDVSVAYGSGGDLLVAFTRQTIDSRGEPGPRRVMARFRRSGHGFGAIADLGPEAGVTDVVTTVTASGRGYVAWGTQDGGIEANEPFDVYATSKPVGPHAFRAALHLFSGRGSDIDRPQGRLGLAVARDGSDGVLAFNGLADGGVGVGTLRPVLVSTTDPRASFQAPTAVPGANGLSGGVAVQPDGTSTVVWSGQRPGGPEQATGIFASTRPPGGAFQAVPELVSLLPQQPAWPSVVAAPVNGGAVQAAWTQFGAGVRISRRG
jgi:hypothetical protein